MNRPVHFPFWCSGWSRGRVSLCHFPLPWSDIYKYWCLCHYLSALHATFRSFSLPLPLYRKSWISPWKRKAIVAADQCFVFQPVDQNLPNTSASRSVGPSRSGGNSGTYYKPCNHRCLNKAVYPDWSLMLPNLLYTFEKFSEKKKQKNSAWQYVARHNYDSILQYHVRL